MKDVKYFCDICGENLGDDKEGIVIFKTYHFSRLKYNHISEIDDLCINCYMKIIDIARMECKKTK